MQARAERDHRAGRQRAAQIAAHGRGGLDLERRQERAAALADQRRREPGCGRLETVQLLDRAGRGDRQALRRGLDRGPPQTRDVDEPPEVRLRLGKQPRAAREPGVARDRAAEILAPPGPRDVRDRVQVHDIPIAPHKAQYGPGSSSRSLATNGRDPNPRPRRVRVRRPGRRRGECRRGSFACRRSGSSRMEPLPRGATHRQSPSRLRTSSLLWRPREHPRSRRPAGRPGRAGPR